jgi:hypothetical protein
MTLIPLDRNNLRINNITASFYSYGNNWYHVTKVNISRIPEEEGMLEITEALNPADGMGLMTTLFHDDGCEVQNEVKVKYSLFPHY